MSDHDKDVRAGQAETAALPDFEAIALPADWEANAGAVIPLAGGVLRLSEAELQAAVASSIGESVNGARVWRQSIERLDSGAEALRMASARLTVVLHRIADGEAGS